MPNSTQLLDRFQRDHARTGQDIELGLRPPYLELLAKLGNPHKHLPPVFHVAGTNGKGSVCAFLRAMLEAAGKRVHVYTSPHLVRFHERIRIAGNLIKEDELCSLLEECEKLAVPGSLTLFEVTTAAALAAFARHSADYAILEVGLGGRLDATNVIDKPLVSLITRLSFDHREYLGDSMEQIAAEKAGIMRDGVPCFAAAQPDEAALKTLRGKAAQAGAVLHVAGEDWRTKPTPDGFRYEDATRGLDLPLPALVGEHQIGNAALAIAALPFLGRDDISQGLLNAEWPARLQRIGQGPLAEILPEGWELWLDGGHNDSAGEALALQARHWRDTDNLPLALVCGMIATKRPREFLAPLAPYAQELVALVIPDEPMSLPAQDIADEAKAAGMRTIYTASSLAEALKECVRRDSHAPRRILVCGSLYLAGKVLESV